MDAQTIYLDYKDKIYSYLLSRLRNTDDAQDMCSKVFEKVLSNLDSFDCAKASISTWIYTITKNTLLDFYKTNKTSFELSDTLQDSCDVQYSVICKDNLENLAKALEKLSSNERKLIILYYYDDVPLKDIAVGMNMSYSNAKRLKKMALENLKNLIDL